MTITQARTTTLPVCMIELRSVYGEWKVYPIGYEAKQFAEIAGTTTLTPRVLRSIERLGYRLMIESGGSGKGQAVLDAMLKSIH
jgi:hypothetical protein